MTIMKAGILHRPTDDSVVNVFARCSHWKVSRGWPFISRGWLFDPSHSNIRRRLAELRGFETCFCRIAIRSDISNTCDDQTCLDYVTAAPKFIRLYDMTRKRSEGRSTLFRQRMNTKRKEIWKIKGKQRSLHYARKHKNLRWTLKDHFTTTDTLGIGKK